ncbi:AEC family transporter [Propionivibrio sp.]|uniref:AEC family transporter n=1 Tax=Propionivibrio sp. TaxID=2212460 RepID=UPI0034589616
MFFTLGAYMIGSDLSWRRIIASPVVMATVLGTLSSLLELPLPRIVLHPVKLLGDVSLPLMLFSLSTHDRRAVVRPEGGIAGALVCPMAGLLIAGLLVPWLPLAAEHQALLSVCRVAARSGTIFWPSRISAIRKNGRHCGYRQRR